MGVKPFMKYIGGKRWLARRIIEMLPPHKLYCEPFGGMGAVMLAKQKSKIEVWNDVDGGLANVMRCVKYHPDALADELRWMLLSRSEWQHWKNNRGETDIQRAARWIMIRHTGFQGGSNKGFHVSRLRPLKPRDAIIEQMLQVSQRLSSVVIEHLDWRRCIDLYDSAESVFYCDPPYADGDQTAYEHAFGEDDHRALAARLRGIKGQWVLSYGDHPLIRELYADCRIDDVRRIRTINQDARREYVELIIRP